MVSADQKRKFFDEYLALNLKEIENETEDQLEAAYKVVMVISAGVESIDSFKFDFYTSTTSIGKSYLEAAIQYFAGAGLIHYADADKTSEDYQAGAQGNEANTPFFVATRDLLARFRENFWNGEW